MFRHGRKTQRIGVGRVADLCPICHTIRAFDVTCVRMADHFYFVPAGGEGPESWEILCHVCGMPIFYDVLPYRSFLRDKKTNLQELLEQTNPCLTELKAERLSLEARLSENRLTESEREALLLEPFVLAERAHIVWGKDRLRRRQFQLAFPFLAMSVVVVGILRSSQGRVSGVSQRWLLIGICSAMVLVMFILGRLASSRKQVTTALIRALTPLRPTRDELSQLRSTVSVQCSDLASRLDLDSIFEQAAANS